MLRFISLLSSEMRAITPMQAMHCISWVGPLPNPSSYYPRAGLFVVSAITPYPAPGVPYCRSDPTPAYEVNHNSVKLTHVSTVESLVNAKWGGFDL